MTTQKLTVTDYVVIAAIIALLIGILVPTYQTYLTRANVLRELEKFIPIREAITNHMKTDGNLETFVADNFRYEGGIGTVVMTLENPDPKLYQKEVWLQTADGKSWHCGTPYHLSKTDNTVTSEGVAPKYLAGPCRKSTIR